MIYLQALVTFDKGDTYELEDWYVNPAYVVEVATSKFHADCHQNDPTRYTEMLEQSPAFSRLKMHDGATVSVLGSARSVSQRLLRSAC